MAYAKGLRIRIHVLVVLVVLALAILGLRVSCRRVQWKETRDQKKSLMKSLMESMLPRGPVPPSGPSPCHNKFSPLSHTQIPFPDDYIGCP
ncbi:Transmembrane protein [Parasponia andersonii]|uniref:Transmembrane protein n=1 Tax=Parasponia andersonii TaxID=3476 RepID=A0A2P5DZM9_PARAD|nr:Transmembrane protein [Parasponia andersonii]